MATGEGTSSPISQSAIRNWINKRQSLPSRVLWRFLLLPIRLADRRTARR